MNEFPPAITEAPAKVLALLVAANGRIDPAELDVLDQLDAFRRVGVKRERFIELVQRCIDDVGHSLCEQSWLRLSDMRYVDALLDAVADDDARLLVCRLAAAAIAADGRITADERLVYSHALTRWRITQASVLSAMRDDAAR